ncbi:MAG: hypothetical protein ABI040_04880 [Rhodoferax sp.]
MNQEKLPKQSKSHVSEILSTENAAGRSTRLYWSAGGPLLEWLIDEARTNNETLDAMSSKLGVTYGYVHQLRTGRRLTRNIRQNFVAKCAAYLGVQVIVVKLLAGIISLSDFSLPGETEEEMIDRALGAIERHKKTRFPLPESPLSLPLDVKKSPLSLPLDVKKSLLTMYGEASGEDVFGLQKLPQIRRILRSAASVFEEMSPAKRGETDRLQNPHGAQSALGGMHP